jgi:hypothetical protein
MALNPASLGSLIKSEIIAVYGAPDDDQRLTNFCNAVANAVVSHITANAIVTVTGVATGGNIAQGTIS